jgi:hypothetical protein
MLANTQGCRKLTLFDGHRREGRYPSTYCHNVIPPHGRAPIGTLYYYIKQHQDRFTTFTGFSRSAVSSTLFDLRHQAVAFVIEIVAFFATSASTSIKSRPPQMRLVSDHGMFYLQSNVRRLFRRSKLNVALGVPRACPDGASRTHCAVDST